MLIMILRLLLLLLPLVLLRISPWALWSSCTRVLARTQRGRGQVTARRVEDVLNRAWTRAVFDDVDDDDVDVYVDEQDDDDGVMWCDDDDDDNDDDDDDDVMMMINAGIRVSNLELDPILDNWFGFRTPL